MESNKIEKQTEDNNKLNIFFSVETIFNTLLKFAEER